MEEIKNGLWTPWARVECLECHGNRNRIEDKPFVETASEWKAAVAPVPLKERNGVTTCDDCGCKVQVAKEVAAEHNLVLALRERGIDAVMCQTGGMMSAAGMSVSDDLRDSDPEHPAEILITFDDDGGEAYWMGVYNADTETSEVSWDNQRFGTIDDVLGWVEENRDKVVALTPSPDVARPLEDLTKEAKERAADKGEPTQKDERNLQAKDMSRDAER